MEAAQEVMVVKSVVCVVMMGMTTARVELGGMSIVAVIQISRCLKGADRKTRCVCFKDGETANLIMYAEDGAIGSMNIPVTLLWPIASSGNADNANPVFMVMVGIRCIKYTQQICS